MVKIKHKSGTLNSGMIFIYPFSVHIIRIEVSLKDKNRLKYN